MPEQLPPPRPGGAARRDRRGRGRRGPDFGPLLDDAGLPVPAVPAQRTRREEFDRILLEVVTDLEARWADELGLVEFGVEEAPMVPEDWRRTAGARVPLASLVRGAGHRPTRLVVFRRPIEHRSGDRDDLAALVLTVVVEQVSELLGVPPEEVDPRYEGGGT